MQAAGGQAAARRYALQSLKKGIYFDQPFIEEARVVTVC